MTQQIPEDSLAPVLCAAMAALLLIGALVLSTRDRPNDDRIARAGEWVTTPTGRSVCRLTVDLQKLQTFSVWMCTQWTGGPPQRGEAVPWLRSGQIMIEGSWRP